MKVSIVMAVYNGEKYISHAINSILNQTYKNIEFIIIDGKSTDKTMNIINSYSHNISKIISEKDNGMYDALNKGFSLSTGELMLWLNSDDYLFPTAIESVVNLMKKYPYIKWVTGRKTYIDKNNIPRKMECFRTNYKNLIQKGFYRGEGLGYIMQETTFWHRDLYDKAGSYIDTKYKLASDYELWHRFSKYEKLYSFNTLLGAFRQHEEQLSSAIDKYEKECDEICNINFFTKKILKILKYPLYIFAMVDYRKKFIIDKNSEITKVKNFAQFM